MDKEFIRWNRIPLNLTQSAPWGNSIAPVVSFSSDSFSCLNEARFILNLSVNSNGAGPVVITRPTVAWFNNVNATINYMTHGEHKTISYNSNPNRGDAGYVLELCDVSFSTFQDNNNLEILTVPFTQTKTTFDVAVPLRYLFDVFSQRKYLPVSTISFTLTFRNLLDIFTPASGTTATFSVLLNSLYINYPSYRVDKIPHSLTAPPLLETYVQPYQLAVNQVALSGQLTVSGIPRKIIHFMLNAGISSAGVSGAYSFNPNPLSLLKTQQFQVGGITIPLNSDYNSQFSNTSEAGIAALYHEWQVITNNFSPNKNSPVTYVSWRDTYRLYAVDLYDENINSSTVVFQLTFTSPIVTACNHVFVVLYEPVYISVN